MKNSVCAVLIVIFLCSVSYAQDQQKMQKAMQKYNKELDKAESAIRREFGPAIVSITRDFRNVSLVVEVDDDAISKILKIRIPRSFMFQKLGFGRPRPAALGPSSPW